MVVISWYAIANAMRYFHNWRYRYAKEKKRRYFLVYPEQDYFTSLKHNAEVELPVEDYSPVSTPANQNANDFLSDCPFLFTAESVMENPAKSKTR